MTRAAPFDDELLTIFSPDLIYEPDPAVLFDITRFLLACIGSGKGPSTSDRWLAIANQGGLVPVETVRQVCLALRARRVLTRIFLAEGEGIRIL